MRNTIERSVLAPKSILESVWRKRMEQRAYISRTWHGRSYLRLHDFFDKGVDIILYYVITAIIFLINTIFGRKLAN